MSVVHDDPWTIEASSGGGGDYVTCPPGNYPATIVGMFDIGTQPESYNGESKDTAKVVIVYELNKKQPNGLPFVMPQKLTFSLNSKANLAALIETLRGRGIGDGERVSIREYLGLPCMVSITNESKTRDGKSVTYHNIGTVAQYPDGLPVPTPVYPITLWSVRTGEPFPTGLDWLPPVYGVSIKDLAEGSREVRKRGIPSEDSDPVVDSVVKNIQGDKIPF